MEPVMLIHGGAGRISSGRCNDKLDGVKFAAKEGYKVLMKGGSSLDAVEAAIRTMESNDAFNAGYGAVLNLEGNVETDASMMNGTTLAAGSVSAVSDIEHPISLARMVMERTPHVMLSAHGAKKFAMEQGVPILSPGSLVTPYSRKALEHFKEHGFVQTEYGPAANIGEVGTVGAVAIDKNGHLAYGTSTGGINGKYVGRVGDTPQLGCGGYADDNFGAVSTTGHGESIAKTCLAFNIVKTMEQGENALDATTKCIEYMTKKLNNTAGAITLSKKGDIGIAFSTPRMAWAYQKCNEVHYGIEKNQDDIEYLDDHDQGEV